MTFAISSLRLAMVFILAAPFVAAAATFKNNTLQVVAFEIFLLFVAFSLLCNTLRGGICYIYTLLFFLALLFLVQEDLLVHQGEGVSSK